MHFGYARVSAKAQHLDTQLELLTAAGVDRLFQEKISGASGREAAYLVDGLLHNDVVESTIHSTNTHGSTEVNFAVTYLIQVAFALRINPFRTSNLPA